MFTCPDGTTSPLSYILDGEDDCDGGEDEMPYMEDTEWVMYQLMHLRLRTDHCH